MDLIQLNKLKGRNLTFTFEIVAHGDLLINLKPKRHTEYKRKALLHYFDTARLRDAMDKAFIKRLESKKFGCSNYE